MAGKMKRKTKFLAGDVVSYRGRVGTVVANQPQAMADVRFHDSTQRVERRKASALQRVRATPSLQGHAEKRAAQISTDRYKKAPEAKQGKGYRLGDAISGAGAGVFIREDPPRTDKTGTTYCGNPIDGLAYYLVVDNSKLGVPKWVTRAELINIAKRMKLPIANKINRLTTTGVTTRDSIVNGAFGEMINQRTEGDLFDVYRELAQLRVKMPNSRNWLALKMGDTTSIPKGSKVELVLPSPKTEENLLLAFNTLKEWVENQRGKSLYSIDLPVTKYIKQRGGKRAQKRLSDEIAIAQKKPVPPGKWPSVELDFATIEDNKVKFWVLSSYGSPGAAKLKKFDGYGYRRWYTMQEGTLFDLVIDASRSDKSIGPRGISPELAKELIISGAISVSMEKGSALVTDPEMEVGSAGEKTTISLWLKDKANSPFFSWIRSNTPLEIRDKEQGSQDTYAPCLSAEEREAIKDFNTSRLRLQQLNNAYKKIKAVFSKLERNPNSFRGDAGFDAKENEDLDFRKLGDVRRVVTQLSGAYARNVTWFNLLQLNARSNNESAREVLEVLRASPASPLTEKNQSVLSLALKQYRSGRGEKGLVSRGGITPSVFTSQSYKDFMARLEADERARKHKRSALEALHFGTLSIGASGLTGETEKGRYAEEEKEYDWDYDWNWVVTLIGSLSVDMEAQKELLLLASLYYGMNGYELAGPLRPGNRPSMPRKGEEDQRPLLMQEISVLSKAASDKQGGSQPLGTLEKYTTWVTYNPVLFEITRLFWPTKRGMDSRFGSILAHAQMLNSIDAVGRFGSGMVEVQKASLTAKSELDVAQRIYSQVSQVPQHSVATILRGRKSVSGEEAQPVLDPLGAEQSPFSVFTRSWALGLTADQAGDEVQAWFNSPLNYLRNLKRERVDIALQNLVQLRGRGLPAIQVAEDYDYARKIVKGNKKPIDARKRSTNKKERRTRRALRRTLGKETKDADVFGDIPDSELRRVHVSVDKRREAEYKALQRFQRSPGNALRRTARGSWQAEPLPSLEPTGMYDAPTVNVLMEKALGYRKPPAQVPFVLGSKGKQLPPKSAIFRAEAEGKESLENLLGEIEAGLKVLKRK